MRWLWAAVWLAACPSKPTAVLECHKAGFAERIRATLADPANLETTVPLEALPRAALGRRVDVAGALVLADGKPAAQAPSRVVYVEAQATTPASAVVESLQGLAGAHELRLLVNGARMVSPDGGMPKVDSEYRDSTTLVQARDRASIAAAGLETAVQRCEPMSKAFHEVAGMPPQKKLAGLVEGVAKTGAQCTCEQLDFPVVEQWLTETVNQWNAPLGWVPLDLAVAKTKATVADLAL